MLKSNKRLFFTLCRIQARMRGIISRKNVKGMTKGRKFMPNDSYNKYTTVTSSKIVR
jgi:hypothetical protein